MHYIIFLTVLQLDRLVKIWFVPSSNKVLNREDKPLFSSSKIHKARILDVSWCAQVPLDIDASA